ncbi:anti-sigma factor family protein [Actinacidiphila paucisporea]|uniref:Putative zinc-finger n=1 Tax=Actinacidiphila paucisporea TaxID=310782 RepID=A0A1M6UU03_9ACTN|nr:zf-HC2 domain-containing protein [Actinacidiphila paucisporea]SHK72644.1 Putative zinc-finger [Actinacidiphila paucisporea]
MSTSGSGTQRAQRTTPAEQHLGDRLAAFVDGELADDARERVQSHLATCPQCKAAATEQRRLKNVVAASELPAISAGLLARLQGLAACGPKDGGDDGTDGGALRGGYGGYDGVHEVHDVREVSQGGRRGPFDGGMLGSEVFASGGRRRPSYLAPAADLVAPGDGKGARGFRVHELARSLTGDQQSAAAAPAAASAAVQASRGRRFAFAAAGAFSMAAIAIGGALPMEAGIDGSVRPDDGPAVTPFSAANSVTDTHGTTPRDMLDARDERRLRQVSVALPGGLASATSVASVTSAALSGERPDPGALTPGALTGDRIPALNGSAPGPAALR